MKITADELADWRREIEDLAFFEPRYIEAPPDKLISLLDEVDRLRARVRSLEATMIRSIERHMQDGGRP